MHVGVVVIVVIAQRFDDGARLLSRRRVIEVNQRMTVDLLIEDREIFPNGFPINRAFAALVHCLMWARPRAASLPVCMPPSGSGASQIRAGGVLKVITSNSEYSLLMSHDSSSTLGKTANLCKISRCDAA